MSISLHQAAENGASSILSPRLVTRGENLTQDPHSIHVDWLSYTVWPAKWERKHPRLPKHFLHGQAPSKLPPAIVAELIALNDLVPWKLRAVYMAKGWQGYDCHITLHRDNGMNGVLAWGGNGGSYHVSLTGAGLVGVELRPMYDHLKVLDASIRRIDIALDDISQTYTGAWAIHAHRAGEFGAAFGRPPKLREIYNEGNIETVYVGSRESGKLLRVYDKGIQTGLQEAGTWWRVELEWRASARREIPLEVLLDPPAYLAGSYPALSFAAAVGVVVKTIAREAKVSIDSAISHCRNQYGKLVGFLRDQGMKAEEIVQALSREGVPGRIGVNLLCGVAV